MDDYEGLYRGNSDTMRQIRKENPEPFRPKMVEAEKPSVLGFLSFMHQNMQRFMEGMTRIEALENIGKNLNKTGRTMRYFEELKKTDNFDVPTLQGLQRQYFPEFYEKEGRE